MKSQKSDNPPAWMVEVHEQAKPELLALSKEMRARFAHIADLLETFGPQRVGLPYIRPIESKLWEMRLHDRDGIARAVYAAIQDRRLLVLHVFIKKTETTPRSAITTALDRLKAHHDSVQETESRTAGRPANPRRLRRNGR